MAKSCSFDIVSEVNMAEVQNAVNQAMMEIRQRYDFREAEQFEQAARELLKEKPELKGVEKFKSALNAVDELKKTLFTNIDFVLSETKTGSRE